MHTIMESAEVFKNGHCSDFRHNAVTLITITPYVVIDGLLWCGERDNLLGTVGNGLLHSAGLAQFALIAIWITYRSPAIVLRLSYGTVATVSLIAVMSHSYIREQHLVPWNEFVWIGFFYYGQNVPAVTPLMAGCIVLVFVGRIFGFRWTLADTLERDSSSNAASAKHVRLSLRELFYCILAIAIALGVAVAIRPYQGWCAELAVRLLDGSFVREVVMSNVLSAIGLALCAWPAVEKLIQLL